MTTPSHLLAVILDLAAIRENGRLSELLLQHAAECRAAGLPAEDRQWQPGFARRSTGSWDAQPRNCWECPTLRRSRQRTRRLAYRPCRDIGLELIAWFRGREPQQEQVAPSDPAVANPERRPRAW